MTQNLHGDAELSVVLPLFNESEQIQEAITRIISTLEGLSYKLILVDDGSTDNSVSLINDLQLPQLQVISYSPNKGKGYALKQGISSISSEYGAYIDADLDIDPSSLIIGLNLLKKNPNLTMAIGSKVHKDSIVQYSRTRKILSKTYRLLTTILFHLSVNDTQTGIKVFRTKEVKNSLVQVSANGWSFDLELLSFVQRDGGTFAEIPVNLNYQFNSNLDSKSALSALKETFIFYKSFRNK